MFCRQCGKEAAATSLFCTNCGSRVGSDEDAVQIGVGPDSAAHVQQVPPMHQQPQMVPVQQAQQSCRQPLVPQQPQMVPMQQAHHHYQVQQQPAVQMVPVLGVDEKYCFSCGRTVKKAAEVCPFCGVRQPMEQVQPHASGMGQTAAPVLSSDDKFCFSCGSTIKRAAAVCPKCGVNQRDRQAINAVDLYCLSCGKTIRKAACVCPFCGVGQHTDPSWW